MEKINLIETKLNEIKVINEKQLQIVNDIDRDCADLKRWVSFIWFIVLFIWIYLPTLKSR
jgi:hypothetical protein